MNWGAFSRKQLDVVLNPDARLNILYGSVRSGKTVASLVAWIYYLLSGPKGELLMVGKTERTLKRNILDVLAEMVGPQNYRLNQGGGELYLFGRRIYLAGANDERSEGKIRGMTLAGAYGDEVTLWPESFFQMLLSRLSVPGARFIGTTNPDGPFHWLKTGFIDRSDQLDMKIWHFTLDDNLNLDPTYISSLKAEYTGLWYKRYILGQWVAAEGAIFDVFDESRHVIEIAPDRFDRLVVGVDYGTYNPTAFVLVGETDGVLYVIDEYYHDGRASGKQKTDAEYASDLRAWLAGRKPNAIIIDPSAASFITQLRRDGIGPIRKADNSVLDGIRTIATRLELEKLFISHRAENLIREFQSYVWDDAAQQRGEDRPVKANDHALDALRYAVHTIWGRGPAVSF